MTSTEPTHASSTAALRAAVHGEVAKAVVGQGALVDAALVGLLAGGHVLVDGPPGLAKSLLATAFVRAFGLEGRRVQFTPDLLPSDLTGTLSLRGSELVFRPGPVFTNLLVADELNRTPPKTQAALLEAMQERQVTVDGVSHPLPEPFLVLATQNPIEFEGTYPLPESQLDRFLLSVSVGYPSGPDERAMLDLRHRGVAPSTIDDVRPVADRAALARATDDADAVTMAAEVGDYLLAVVRRTRELPSVALGASPRAAVHLAAAARATACISGRSFVTPDDVAGLAVPVLAHRLVLTPEAELDRFTSADAIHTALRQVEVPR
jgi:MoxR-like ATPase